MSSDSRHFALSAPVVHEWLERICREVQRRKIILVGEGVTAHEYYSILNRAEINLTRITTKGFLEKRDWDCDVCGGGKPFFLFAAPSKLVELSTHAAALGFLAYQDFFSHFYALRNRLVLDLRGGRVPDPAMLVSAMDTALSLRTLGGIDVLASSVTILEEIWVVIADRAKALHSRAILFPVLGDQVRTLKSTGFDAIEINSTHLEVDEENYEYLFMTLLTEVRANEKAYLTISEEIFKKYGFRHSRVYIDSIHPWYFDARLFAFESEKLIPAVEVKVGKLNKCLSRRMFPVLDERLMLKKCSLYDDLGRTEYPISDIESDGFIRDRKTLCERCVKFKLHRIG